MKRILKIGMDVHTTNYTLCAMEPIIGEDDRVFATIKVTPDYKNILMFIENLKLKLGLNDEYDIQRGYEAGCLGYKSKDLRARQNGNAADVIAYADKANTRLRSRYYKFIRHGKKRNVAVAAIARELACFVWGLPGGSAVKNLSAM